MKEFKKVRNGVAGPLDPLGFIAQNLEPLIPNMVTEYDSEEHDFKVKHIGTVTFIPYLVKVVQELIEKNEQLEDRIRTLEG
jgi:chaperonin cofactor prefoldin